MVGSIISAGLSAWGAIKNASDQKRMLEKDLAENAAEQAEARSRMTTAQYGNYMYSGANRYFTKAADELHDYARQQRGIAMATGQGNKRNMDYVGKGLADAASGASAADQNARLAMYNSAEQRLQALQDQKHQINREQMANAATANKALVDAAGSIGQGFESLEGSLGSGESVADDGGSKTSKVSAASNVSKGSIIKPYHTGATQQDKTIKIKF